MSKINQYKNLITHISNPTEDQMECEKLFDQAVEIFHPYDEYFMNYMEFLWKTFYNNPEDEEFERRSYDILNLMIKNYYQNLPKYFHDIGQWFFNYGNSISISVLSNFLCQVDLFLTEWTWILFCNKSLRF